MAIYLDNAATSFPKPTAVWDAMDHYSRSLGAPVGRGGYSTAVEVETVVGRCRKLAADLLGLPQPNGCVLTFNCTDSLNTVIHGLLRPGDHVVTSQIEHNSVLRPLRQWESRGVDTTIVSVDHTHRIEPSHVRAAMRPETRLVLITHASNVTGVIQPIGDIAEIVRDHSACFAVDAAQTAGQIPIDMMDASIDFVACAGHKSLLGPLGTGILAIHPDAEEVLLSSRQGGTGSASESDLQPKQLPDRLESGNHNAPGLVGLTAGLEFLITQGIASLADHKRALCEKLATRLSADPRVRIYGRSDAQDTVGILSVNIGEMEPHTVAAILDQNFQIQTRAGLHCAPGAHRSLGTSQTGGTLRISPGFATTDDEIEHTAAALLDIAAS